MNYRGAAQWTDEDASSAAIAAAEAGIDAGLPTWRNRMLRGSDGLWYLQLRPPLAWPDGYPPRSSPWLWDGWNKFNAKLYPLKEGVALLKGPDNPEAEMDRRRALVAAYEADVAAEKVKVEQRRLAQEEASRARAERDKEFRRDDWTAATLPGQLFFTLALLEGETDPAKRAAAFKELGARCLSLAKRHPGQTPGLPFPDARWW
jgi:hypothetical protein